MTRRNMILSGAVLLGLYLGLRQPLQLPVAQPLVLAEHPAPAAAPVTPAASAPTPAPAREPSPNPATASPGELIAWRATEEVRRGVRYDASYQRLAYPGGDVDLAVGACTDLVIRALRHAGYDLQRLVHEDMRANFAVYPKLWGLDGPDRNIDHRRVPNLACFLRRRGRTLPTDPTDASWQPGDIVTWNLTPTAQHCGIVTALTTPEGRPLIAHNLGGAKLEDCLTAWTITGHYRYPG